MAAWGLSQQSRGSGELSAQCGYLGPLIGGGKHLYVQSDPGSPADTTRVGSCPSPTLPQARGALGLSPRKAQLRGPT